MDNGQLTAGKAHQVPVGEGGHERIFSDAQIGAEQAERLRIYEKEQRQRQYDLYYCAAITGVLAHYGMGNSGAQRLDEIAHRMACQSMMTEDVRRTAVGS